VACLIQFGLPAKAREGTSNNSVSEIRENERNRLPSSLVTPMISLRGKRGQPDFPLQERRVNSTKMMQIILSLRFNG
jgi:hypothetical protein